MANPQKSIKDLEKELEESRKQILRLRKQLLESSKLATLGKMSGEIAHEINNPLAIILGRVDQLEMLYDEDELDAASFKETVGKIKGTIKRITQIIRGLRAFARDESENNFQSVFAESIMEDVLGLCQEKFKNAGITIHTEFHGKNMPIECAKVRVTQVILNLLNNAFDAIKHLEDPWIKIKFLTDNKQNYIEVTDCGKGIPQEIVDKILSPYFTTKDESSGIGLGLSISNDIMQSHSGKLEILKDQPHTTFRLSFPKKLVIPK